MKLKQKTDIQVTICSTTTFRYTWQDTETQKQVPSRTCPISSYRRTQYFMRAHTCNILQELRASTSNITF